MSEREKPRNQGEGDREAAKRYSEETREFIDSGKVDEAAERAKEQDPAEGKAAEKAGRDRAKEMDPAVHRDHKKPTND